MSTQTTMQWIVTGLKKNYGVWPVVAFAFGFAPLLVVVQSLHQMRGPDARFGKDFEPWHKFENKQFKFISHGGDYANYVHPRPRYEE